MQVVLSKHGGGKTNADGGRSSTKLSTVESARVLDDFLREFQPSKDRNPRGGGRSTKKLNSYERTLRDALIKECLSACKGTKRCSHCGAYSPKIRQDSSNKFFRGLLSARNQKQNQLDGLLVQSALVGQHDDTNNDGYNSDDSAARRRSIVAAPEEADDMDVDDEEDDDDDDDEEGAAGTTGMKEKDHFMHTKEIQAQLQRTWKSDPYLLNCLFGSGNNNFDEHGYKFFFLQAIAVPPNRFRPSMEMNGAQVEHSQNQYLTKVIQLNESVRSLFAAGNEPNAYTAWINLQTTVNCFMDSSKDPSAVPSHLVAPGIRQILERKEGLFRKNMMGKRVDFACRSVISPDPYVGGNEIGLPRYFATVLTYPTPVTTLNVKELRTLVERGPSHYPGARWVQTADGKRIDLSKMKPQSRAAVAAMLLTNLKKSGKPTIVGRQLVDGDYVLMNRQVRTTRDSCFLFRE